MFSAPQQGEGWSVLPNMRIAVVLKVDLVQTGAQYAIRPIRSLTLGQLVI